MPHHLDLVLVDTVNRTLKFINILDLLDYLDLDLETKTNCNE